MHKELTREIEQAIHTVASEIPSAHLDDQLDAVYGIIGDEAFWTNEAAITRRLKGVR